MPQMTNAQVRVIDPILSTHSQGYRHPDHVGLYLFPRVPVDKSGGQIIEFGKESFRQYNARRSPGSATKRIQVGYAGKPYSLVQDSLEGMVAREHASEAEVPGINLGQQAVNTTMGALSLALEVEQAGLARGAANYDNDHKVDLASTKWSDSANNPATHIRAGEEAIRKSTGMRPNTLVLSAAAFAGIRENEKVMERFKYTNPESITTQMLAGLFNLKRVVVGDAVVADSNDAFSDVWGSDAVLAYVANDGSTLQQPSYGYTYALNGHPFVEEAYYDRNPKSWIYPVTYERAPVHSGISAGYLFQNVV